MTFNPVAHYGVTTDMLDSVSGEYRAALLMIDSEIQSIENGHARKSEIKERLLRAREGLVSSFTDKSWMLQTVLQLGAGGSSVAAGVGMKDFKRYGEAASTLSGAPGQLNRQGTEYQRTLVSDAEAIQRELDGDSRKADDLLGRINQVISQIAESRLQAARAG